MQPGIVVYATGNNQPKVKRHGVDMSKKHEFRYINFASFWGLLAILGFGFASILVPLWFVRIGIIGLNPNLAAWSFTIAILEQFLLLMTC